ncbi:ABC transporter, phosphonate, periplasmic substrate-binding protein [Tepidimonas charontis]|uniref:ABC transporter, phosphonate, periplasmic substrate-binding protein n=2 Tax=Tepidimonas charontis TaxID=2267262 RepID=A0A554XIM5_9BURK|nr:ABC transporter, phosphonate, periplasmic substrate-binding protein [Tepidimonas charontis]
MFMSSLSRRHMLFAAVCGAWAPGLHAQTRPVFGVVPYLPARRLAHLYSPLLPVLGRVLGSEPEFASAPGYAQHLGRLRAGSYDIVADSLFLARLAQRELGHVPLVRTRAALQPLLVVAADAPDTDVVRAVRGRTLAVTDRLAALSVLGLRALRDLGLTPDSDFRVVESGTHANSLHWLATGQAQVAIVSVTTLKQVDELLRRQVRVLAQLPEGLSAVVYHAAPRWAHRASALTQALLSFADEPAGRAFIDALGHGGLVPARKAELEALDPLVVEMYRQLGRGS